MVSPSDLSLIYLFYLGHPLMSLSISRNAKRRQLHAVVSSCSPRTYGGFYLSDEFTSTVSHHKPMHLHLMLPGLHNRTTLGSVDRPDRVACRQLTDLHTSFGEPL